LHLGIGSGLAGFLLTVALLSVSVRIHFALLSIVATVFGGLVAFVVTWMVDIERTQALLAKAVDPATLPTDGRYTTPRTWGVYQVARFSRGKRTQFHYIGNHPVRHMELVREYGSADLVALFTDRAEAEELQYRLNSGRKRA
jgi:hypothetical protein